MSTFVLVPVTKQKQANADARFNNNPFNECLARARGQGCFVCTPFDQMTN